MQAKQGPPRPVHDRPCPPPPNDPNSFSGLQPVAGFGFGAAAVSASASASASAEPSLPGQLDGDVAQCLRHLSKKDATTKLKALQSLRDLVPSRSPQDLVAALPPWAYSFKRLMMDPAKSVRSEACATMGALAAAVGKQLAPQLRALLPPWWLATFDPYADVAAAARRSLGEAFPGRKLGGPSGALVFCRCGSTGGCCGRRPGGWGATVSIVPCAPNSVPTLAHCTFLKTPSQTTSNPT